MPLTVKQVKREKRRGRYFDGKGLYLQITKKGVKSWLFRYERAGSERWHGLGPVHRFTLDEARERARLARRQLVDGHDPIEAKNAARAAEAKEAARTITFRDATKQYYGQHRGKWKNRKHAAQFLSTLETYAWPKIGAMLVADITTADVRRVLEQPVPNPKREPPTLWHNKTETASRVRQRIEKVMAWCTVREYRTGDNPARWDGHLKEDMPAPTKIKVVKHHTALPFAEIHDFMVALRKRPAMAARALEFLILTAARTSDVTGMRWSEVDLETRTWTIPGARMKMSRGIRRPLSDRAVTILKELPREGEYVFVGQKKGEHLSNGAMSTLLKRMKVMPDKAVVHGFRSTFMTWSSERTNFPTWVAKAQLSHSKGDKLEEAYDRGDGFDKRVRLLQQWTDFIDLPPDEGVVVPIREKRA